MRVLTLMLRQLSQKRRIRIMLELFMQKIGIQMLQMEFRWTFLVSKNWNSKGGSEKIFISPFAAFTKWIYRLLKTVWIYTCKDGLNQDPITL